MKFSARTLMLCIETAEKMGNVLDAHMYGNELISLDIEASDGTKVSFSLSVKEDGE